MRGPAPASQRRRRADIQRTVGRGLGDEVARPARNETRGKQRPGGVQMTAAWRIAAGRSTAGRRGRGMGRNPRHALWIQATPPQHKPQRRYAIFAGQRGPALATAALSVHRYRFGHAPDPAALPAGVVVIIEAAVRSCIAEERKPKNAVAWTTPLRRASLRRMCTRSVHAAPPGYSLAVTASTSSDAACNFVVSRLGRDPHQYAPSRSPRRSPFDKQQC